MSDFSYFWSEAMHRKIKYLVWMRTNHNKEWTKYEGKHWIGAPRCRKIKTISKKIVCFSFLEHREVIWPHTKKLNCSTFFRLSFEAKKIGKKRPHLLATSFRKKIENIFFLATRWRYRTKIATICLRIENYIRL